MIDSFMTIDSI